jgi:acetyltransferase-like isoleucine patch superfamily enzyme
MLNLRRSRGRSLADFARLLFDRIHQSMGTAISTWIFRAAAGFRNVRCGKGVEVFGKVIVRSPAGKVILGNRVKLISSPWRSSAAGISHAIRLRTFTASARIILDDDSGISGGSLTARSKTIRIGKKTMIGPDCIIVDSDFHIPWPPDKRNDYPGVERDADVRIGDNVWMGARCMVLKGVSIGDNSVIAAGSVVVNNIPANSLAAGNPARVIKSYVAG